jgi:osmotically-inducible protein OsmY
MKTDRQIQKDVMDELAFDPSVTSENIGVSVKDWVVTLNGYVPSYGEKYAAEKAAFRVAGVKAVAEEINVKLPGSSIKTDADIAKAAADALEWRSNIPSTVQISVEDGQVILRGKVEWAYQREAATDAVRYLNGVVGVTNHISVRPRVRPDDIKERIEKALVRSAEEDAKKIRVEASDGKVVLSGTVHSRSEFDDAMRAAWAVPGVTSVDNRLSIG